MNKRTLLYSAALLFLLTTASIFFNQGRARGVVDIGDINLSTNSSQYSLGQTVNFTGVIDFALNEEASILQVALVVAGPGSQDLDVALPTTEVTNLDISSFTGVTGSLDLTVAYTDVTRDGGTLPRGTLPGSTLPGGTLPGGTLPGGTLPGDKCPGGTFTAAGLPHCQLHVVVLRNVHSGTCHHNLR